MNKKKNPVNRRDFILTGKMSRVVLAVSAPLMLNNLIQTVYNLTDSMFITLIDPLAVGAVSFLFPLIYLNVAFCVSFSSAGMALISQYIGAGKPKKARQSAAQLVIASVFICAATLTVCYAFGPWIASALGLKDVMYEYGMAYYKLILLEVPFMYIMNIYNAIRQGQGDTVTPMIYTVISAGLNIALDPIFMFTLHMGISGAALATVISRAVVCIPQIITLMTTNAGIRLVPASIKFEKAIMKKLFQIGFPSVTGEFISNFGFMILNYCIIGFGEITMTAFAIGNRILNVLTMPVMGIGSGLAIIVGQHLGAKDISRAKEGIRQSMFIGSAIMIVGAIIMVFTANITVGFFAGGNADIFDQTKTYLNYLAYTIVFLAIFENFIGIFQGSGQSKAILATSLVRLWMVRLPMIYLLGRFTSLGETAVWISMGLSNAIVSLICYMIYKTGKWEQGKIGEDMPSIEDLKNI